MKWICCFALVTKFYFKLDPDQESPYKLDADPGLIKIFCDVNEWLLQRRMREGYHRVELNKTVWEVADRYVNLTPVGSGAYGQVRTFHLDYKDNTFILAFIQQKNFLDGISLVPYWQIAGSVGDPYLSASYLYGSGSLLLFSTKNHENCFKK